MEASTKTITKSSSPVTVPAKTAEPVAPESTVVKHDTCIICLENFPSGGSACCLRERDLNEASAGKNQPDLKS